MLFKTSCKSSINLRVSRTTARSFSIMTTLLFERTTSLTQAILASLNLTVALLQYHCICASQVLQLIHCSLVYRVFCPGSGVRTKGFKVRVHAGWQFQGLPCDELATHPLLWCRRHLFPKRMESQLKQISGHTCRSLKSGSPTRLSCSSDIIINATEATHGSWSLASGQIVVLYKKGKPAESRNMKVKAQL
jgi:hypothetical protein